MEDSIEDLYRAGTDESPLFEVLNNEVWLITDPRLYYPLDQDPPRSITRATPVVRLWKTSSSSVPDTLITERHPYLKEIVLVKLKEPERVEDYAGKLKEILGSITWTRATVPPCKRGMSRMNFSVLVHAVLEYLKDHHPAAPEESNFQAELKAASHWYWFKDNERTQFVSRHFDDMQLKKVAKVALKRWIQKLKKLELQAEKETQGDGDDSDSSGSIEEQISDLEEAIFSLSMYYNKALEENNDTSSTITESPSNSYSTKAKECSEMSETADVIAAASVRGVNGSNPAYPPVHQAVCEDPPTKTHQSSILVSC